MAAALHYFDFAVADLARHQLMDSTPADFQPSPQAYEASIRTYALMSQHLPLSEQADIDIYTALIAGLVSQQLANDPGGQRWRRLLPGSSPCSPTTSACHPLVRKRARSWIHAHLSFPIRPPSNSPAPNTGGPSNCSARSTADWAQRTDCPEWDVREMACHMLGMLEMAASVRENFRQQRLSMRAGGDPLDALTALQVSERRAWTPTEIIERYAQRAPRAVAGRRRLPAFLRDRRLPGDQRVNGAEEPWTVGYLSDIILTRDPWMHQIDISRATGRPMHLTADHDGVIVADVVAEWSDRHGKDFTLTLDGPAAAPGRWGRTGLFCTSRRSNSAVACPGDPAP